MELWKRGKVTVKKPLSHTPRWTLLFVYSLVPGSRPLWFKLWLNQSVACQVSSPRHLWMCNYQTWHRLFTPSINMHQSWSDHKRTAHSTSVHTSHYNASPHASRATACDWIPQSHSQKRVHRWNKWTSFRTRKEITMYYVCGQNKEFVHFQRSSWEQEAVLYWLLFTVFGKSHVYHQVIKSVPSLFGKSLKIQRFH